MKLRSPAPWSWTFFAVSVALAAQALALLNPDFLVVDCEERFNAAHGVALAQGHWDALLELQYRKFCGGCTFDAALAGLLFSVLPPSFGVWKLVPLAFTAGIAGVGFRGLYRLASPLAAAVFVALVCLAPGAWVRLALLGWGNHYEAGLFCLVLVFATVSPPSNRGHLGIGLFAGFALWFGFSSTFAVATLVGWLLIRRRLGALPWFALGFLFAPIMWTLQFLTTDQHAFGTIYADGEAVPSLLRVPHKLETLLRPRQLAGLFGLPRLSIGIPLGVGVFAALSTATVATIRQLRRLPSLKSPTVPVVLWSALAVWTCLYLVVDFQLELRSGEGAPSAAGLRYAAPWMPISWAWVAVLAAGWWTRNRRLQAVLLLSPFVVSGVLTKAAILTAPMPNARLLQLDATDHENYRFIQSYALDPRDHPTCAGTDANHRAAHAFAAGRHATLGLLGAELPLTELPPVVEPSEHFFAGVGQALVDHADSDAIGGLRVLEDLDDTLRVLPMDGQSAALSEATWWRAYRDEPHGFARGAVGSATALTRLLRATRTAPPILRDAALHSLGRRWGLTLGRFGQVGTLAFPAARTGPADAPGLAAFARGLGYGLGTKWGPISAAPRPARMPPELDAPFAEGLADGAADQWSHAELPVITATAPDGDPWIDAAADRWWGPAPTMYCPCRATCW